MLSSRWTNIVENLHIRLFAAHNIKIASGTWDSRNVQDSFWRFYVNDRDGASLQLPDGVFPLQGGRMYFVPEDVFFSCANDKAVGHFYIHFDVLGLPRAVLQNFFNVPLEIGAVNQEASELIEDAKCRKNFDIALQCRAKGLLFTALADIFGRETARDDSQLWRLTLRHAPVAPALQYIEENLGGNLDNHTLALQCHWSEDHFARRFRDCVGQTPTQYVRERRVAIASQQLLFTSKSIEDIARENGFADRFHFSRIFARQKHCGPAAYRKATRV